MSTKPVVTSMSINLSSLPQSSEPLMAYSLLTGNNAFPLSMGTSAVSKKWLLDNDCHDVCMESTGKYWIPVFKILEGQVNVTIANPKWVKAVKGNKDDTNDSKWIGDLFRLGLVPGSWH